MVAESEPRNLHLQLSPEPPDTRQTLRTTVLDQEGTVSQNNTRAQISLVRNISTALTTAMPVQYNVCGSKAWVLLLLVLI